MNLVQYECNTRYALLLLLLLLLLYIYICTHLYIDYRILVI